MSNRNPQLLALLAVLLLGWGGYALHNQLQKSDGSQESSAVAMINTPKINSAQVYSPSGSNLQSDQTLPSSIPPFNFSDDNTGENIIIKTDAGSYEGDTGITSYLSVQNISSITQNATVQFYFPSGMNASVAMLEKETENGWQKVPLSSTGAPRPDAFIVLKPMPSELSVRNSFKTAIPAGQTQIFRAQIKYDTGARGEFWIEAIGDNGGYGLLDPSFGPHLKIRGGGAPGIAGLQAFKLKGGGSGGGGGSVSYDNATGGSCDGVETQGGSASSCVESSGEILTMPHTVSSGSNRALVVGCVVSGGAGTAQPAISSITYAGISLAQKKSQGGNYYIAYWALPDGVQPTSGTNDVVVTLASTLSGLDIMSCVAISATGVDQTTQFSSTDNGNGGTGTTANLTLSANGTNDMGFNFVCNGTSVGASTETMRYDAPDNTNGACETMGAATSGGGDTSHSWTVGNDSWLMVGGAFKATSSSGGTSGSVKFR